MIALPRGDEFGGAMRGLLGKRGKADADEAAVRLALLLPRADRRQVDKLGAEPHAARIVAVVEHACRRSVVNGICSGRTMFSARTSTGSRPTARATSSIVRSIAKHAPGRPTPR